MIVRRNGFLGLLSAIAFVFVSWLSRPIHAGQPEVISVPPDEFTKPIQISADVFGDDCVVTITPRVAGAIHSVRWRGKEFIDSFDHGRQLQSASNFDCNGQFFSETFNPTEAGSRVDGAGDQSTSRLLHLIHTKNQLQTTTQMAFWLQPGQFSSGNPAKNTSALSDHLLTKRVTVGFRQWANVIRYESTFTTPVGETHRYAQYEAVTGYMPDEFDTFWKVAGTELLSLSDGPGEQGDPIILATNDRQFAMGIYSPSQPSKGFANAGYGRFRFPAAKVTKWNSVFRFKGKTPLPAGDFYFDNYVVIGDLETTHKTIVALRDYFRNQKTAPNHKSKPSKEIQ